MMPHDSTQAAYSHSQWLERWTRLQQQYDLETRAEEQWRIEGLLEAMHPKLVAACQQEASRLRGNGSYPAAIDVWRQLQLHLADTTLPDYAQASHEIAALEDLQAQALQASQLRASLARIKAIKPIFPALSAALKQPVDTAEYQLLLEQIDFFLISAEVDVEGFRLWWDEEYAEPGRQTGQAINIALLADKVKQGNNALFIGSGISAAHPEHDLIQQLAARVGYHGFNGSLSAIAEYYHLHSDYGPNALLQELNRLLPDSREVRLYRALARVSVPLVLISAVYDNLLEAAFLLTGKPYVELASIAKPGIGYGIGHLLVSFSDGSQPPRVYSEEALSGLRLLEKGYSVIYRLRGDCQPPAGGADTPWREALTLTESHYFNFARHANDIIPNYLAGLLRHRGLLFVGYRPREWEERLLAHALLEKRKYAEERPLVLSDIPPEPLEAAFWKKRNVDVHRIDMQALDAYLAEVQA